jgi:hypothetical protein
VSEYKVDEWIPFAQAQLGGAAALAGLVFVALSINLRLVLASPFLVRRAAEAIVQFGGILAVSTVVMIPGQGAVALGWELVILGVGLLIAIGVLQRGRFWIDPATGERTTVELSVVIRRVFGFGAPLFVVIAGVSLVAGSGGGLHWWVGAVLLAFSAALSGAWVLLIEIMR